MAGNFRARIRQRIARPLLEDSEKEKSELSEQVAQLMRDKSALTVDNAQLRVDKGLLVGDNAKLKRDNTALLQQADTDPLTGLGNRRRLYAVIEREQKRVNRGEIENFAVFAMDLDYFKTVNDTYGHPVGDMVLNRFKEIVSHQLRPLDELCRVGGDEFTAVFSGVSTKEEAVAIADRILKELSETQVKMPNGDTYTISASIGIAFYRHGISLEEPAALLE